MWVGKTFDNHQAAAEPYETWVWIPFMKVEDKTQIYASCRVTTQFSIPADQMQERLI